jgi:hypothetical protein
MSKTAALPVVDDDALNPKVAVSCLDFLLIELVPLAQRMAEGLHAREQALVDEFQQSKIFNNRDATASATDEKAGTSTTQGEAGPAQNSGTALGPSGMSGEIRDAVFWRLDNLGYRVGQGLVERYACHSAFDRRNRRAGKASGTRHDDKS